MSGKGSGRRPQKVDEQTFASNWERIFSGRSTAASASGSNPADLGSSPSAPAIYVDDATGAEVTE